MRLRFLGFLLVIIMSTPVSGQILGDSGKVWLGVNLADVISDNDQPKLTLDYNFVSNNHFRYQIGYNSTSGDLEKDINGEFSQLTGFGGDTTISGSPYSSCSTSMQLGYYRTSQVGNRFSVYFGLDLILRRMSSSSELNMRVEREFSSNQKQFITIREKSRSTTVSYGAAPMFGLQFDASNRVRIGVEFSSQFLVTDFEEEVNRNMVQTSSFDPRVFEDRNAGSNSWTEQSHDFNPLSGFFLYYRL